MSTDERNIATLVSPNDYMRQLNSVAGLTVENLIFLKRKFVSRSGWELERHPLSELTGILYSSYVPIVRVVGGVLLVLLIGSVLYLLGVYWDSLEPGQRVPVGAIAVAGIFGLKLLFGARQHKLVFVLKSGGKLTWRSRAGDFDLMKPAVESIVAFAKERALLLVPGEHR
jgi:hypothetical protein